MSSPSPSTYNIHPSKLPLQEVKPVTISKIEISTEDLDRLQKILQSKRSGPMAKDLHQRKIIGICDTCGTVPEFFVTRYYDGCSRIEKYCASCLQKEKDKGNIH